MTLWITGQISANTLAPTIANLRNARAVTMPFSVPGLMPNSVFTFWLNNTDMTWATRQSGTKMGAGLTSDIAGKLDFEFLAEMVMSGGARGDLTKVYNFQVRDISGKNVATSVQKQVLAVRT